MTAIKETNVTGHVKPLASGTRTRAVPSTYSSVMRQNLSPINTVEIDRTVLYLENDPVSAHIRKDDLWGHVTKIDGIPVPNEEWIAIDYHDAYYNYYQICTKHYTIDGTPGVPPTTIFPESFILTDPSGAQAEYVFVRIIED